MPHILTTIQSICKWLIRGPTAVHNTQRGWSLQGKMDPLQPSWCLSACDAPLSASLPDNLKTFYAPFETGNILPAVKIPADPNTYPLALTIPKVSRAFKRMNTLKAPGPKSDSDLYMLQADHYHLRFLPLTGMCTQLSLVFPVLTMTALLNHSSNTIFKFADNKTIQWFITNGDEKFYRDEVSALSEWCANNNFSLNVNKIK